MVSTSEQSSQVPQFVDGKIQGVEIRPLEKFTDQRGWLIELFRNDELPSENVPVMAYVSETSPGVARGPHEHEQQSDYFAFVGPGVFKLYMWDARQESPTFGNKHTVLLGESQRTTVSIPPGVVHAYKNVGQSNGWVFNAPNALYAGEGKSGPVDEIRHEDMEESPYTLD